MARRKAEIKPIRGNRLKSLCETENITQYQLADRIHISQQTISKIVNHQANLTEATAKEITKEFPGYSFDWLMGYDLEPVSFDSPLEFEKEWHRRGGVHPVTSLTVAEARIAVALEKMNRNGWKIAVSMIETLSDLSDFQRSEEKDNG